MSKSLERTILFITGIGLGGALVCFIYGGVLWAGGFLAGAALSGVNHWMMRRMVDTLGTPVEEVEQHLVQVNEDSRQTEPSLVQESLESAPQPAVESATDSQVAPDEESEPKRPPITGIHTFSAVAVGMRYFLLFGVGYVIVKYSGVSALALITGCFTAFAATILEFLYELIYART